MAQTQLKTASKAATKPAVKTAPKTAPKVAAKATAKERTATLVKIKSIKVFALNNRPVSQGKLFAHTHAALTYFGLFGKGNPAPRKAVEHVMGKRAVGNHLHEGNMAADKGVLRLTDAGIAKFGARTSAAGFDKALSDAYLAAIKDGKVNEAFGIRQQNLVAMTVYL